MLRAQTQHFSCWQIQKLITLIYNLLCSKNCFIYFLMLSNTISITPIPFKKLSLKQVKSFAQGYTVNKRQRKNFIKTQNLSSQYFPGLSLFLRSCPRHRFPFFFCCSWGRQQSPLSSLPPAAEEFTTRKINSLQDSDSYFIQA